MSKGIFGCILASALVSGCVLPEIVPVVSFRGDTAFTKEERACVETGLQHWRDQTSGLADARVKWDYMSDDVPSVRKLWYEPKILRWNSEMPLVAEKDRSLQIDCLESLPPDGTASMCAGVKLLGEIVPHRGIHSEYLNKANPLELRLVMDRLVDEDGSHKNKCVITVMHELGHVWGLDHIPRNVQNVMFPSINASQEACLKPDDILGFCFMNNCGHIEMKPCPYKAETDDNE